MRRRGTSQGRRCLESSLGIKLKQVGWPCTSCAIHADVPQASQCFMQYTPSPSCAPLWRASALLAVNYWASISVVMHINFQGGWCRKILYIRRQLSRLRCAVHCSQQYRLAVCSGAKGDRVGKSSSPQPTAEAGKGSRKRERSPEARNGRERSAKDSSRADKESSRKRSARDEADRGSRRAEDSHSDRHRSSRGSDARRGSPAERDKRRKKDSPKPERARDSKSARDVAGSGKQAGRQPGTAEGSSAKRDAQKEAAAAPGLSPAAAPAAAGPSGSTKQQDGDSTAAAAVAPEAGRHSGAAQKAPEAELAAGDIDSAAQGANAELPPPPPPGAPTAGACRRTISWSARTASAGVLPFVARKKQRAVSKSMCSQILYSCGRALACRQDAAHGAPMNIYCLAMCVGAALLLGRGPPNIYLVPTKDFCVGSDRHPRSDGVPFSFWTYI